MLLKARSANQKKGDYMTKRYAKSLPDYDEVEFDEESVLNSRKVGSDLLTSVSLPSEVVEELKAIAEKKRHPLLGFDEKFYFGRLTEIETSFITVLDKGLIKLEN